MDQSQKYDIHMQNNRGTKEYIQSGGNCPLRVWDGECLEKNRRKLSRKVEMFCSSIWVAVTQEFNSQNSLNLRCLSGSVG